MKFHMISPLKIHERLTTNSPPGTESSHPQRCSAELAQQFVHWNITICNRSIPGISTINVPCSIAMFSFY